MFQCTQVEVFLLLGLVVANAAQAQFRSWSSRRSRRSERRDPRGQTGYHRKPISRYLLQVAGPSISRGRRR